jgi:protocatechuate 3,4-dioxygenase, beta subunit
MMMYAKHGWHLRMRGKIAPTNCIFALGDFAGAFLLAFALLARFPQESGRVPAAPKDVTWKTDVVPSGEPGERLTVSGQVFTPDGETPVAGIIVYAYNTDASGHYAKEGGVAHPRLHGWMKTDEQGRFEFHTIYAGHYPGTRIPAHVHFQMYGARYPPQWVGELNFEGDPMLTEEMKAASHSKGKFSTIQSVTRDAGVAHVHITLRVSKVSNFTGLG